jgi:hypothetical protein
MPNLATELVGLAESPQHSQTGQVTISLTQEKAVRVSNTEDFGMDACRNGSLQYLGIFNNAVTGIAPLQVIPSAVAMWAITNTSTTAYMWVVELGVVLVSGTAGATGNCVYVCPFTAPAQTGLATGMAVVNANGGTTATTTLSVKSSVTITTPATSATWYPIAQTDSAASVAVASLSIINRNVGGRICIQPGKSIGIHVSGATGTTPLFAPYLAWLETTATTG